MARVLLDLNNPVFQQAWFALGREESLAVLSTMRKLSQLDWSEVYRDQGLRWEAILSRTGRSGQRLYSVRVTRNVRAVAWREADYMRFLSLHPDHDSAYR